TTCCWANFIQSASKTALFAATCLPLKVIAIPGLPPLKPSVTIPSACKNFKNSKASLGQPSSRLRARASASSLSSRGKYTGHSVRVDICPCVAPARGCVHDVAVGHPLGEGVLYSDPNTELE